MIGSYGTAILVVSLLATAAIVGAYVLAYASHCFLTVLEQTAAGAQRIDWPDEPFHDWLWKTFYFLWLTAIWLIPISIVVRLLDLLLAGKMAVAGGLFALVFPISLLSSLSASSKLVVLTWPVLRRLPAIGHRLPLFYLATAVLLAGCGAVAGFGLSGWQSFRTSAAAAGPGWLGGLLDIWAWLIVLPVTALVAGLTLLIYARLAGRIGFLLRQVQIAAGEEDDEEEEEEEAAVEAHHESARELPIPAPVAARPTGETNGEVYGLVEDASPRPPVLIEVPLRRPMAGPERKPESGPLPPLTPPGTFAFLSQRATWGVLTWLTVGGSVLLAVIRIEIMLWPF